MITHKINIDLIRRGVTRTVDVVQDDKYSRNLEITLTADGKSWDIPEGCSIAISYTKPDRTKGKYDTLPDGTVAWSYTGNILTVALAPQALTFAGVVPVHIHIYSGESVLSTFEIRLVVQRNPAINAESEDYVPFNGFLPQPETAKVGQLFRVKTVDENGKVTAVEAVNAPAAEGGAAEILVVTIVTEDNGVTYKSSHTSVEIKAAMDAGQVPVAKVPILSGTVLFDTYMDFAFIAESGADGIFSVIFDMATLSNSGCMSYIASVSSDGSAYVSDHSIGLPSGVKSGQYLVAKTVSNGYITTLGVVDPPSGGAAEVPYFDLSAMGLPAVPVDGTEVSVAGVDLTEIAAAMQKGPIHVSHDFIDGDVTFKVSKTVTPVVQSGYICADGVVVNNAGNISSTYSLGFYPDTGTIRAVLKPYASSANVWETIIDYTVPEDCATVKLATDINGNAFSLKKAVAYVIVERAADFATANAAIRPSFDSSIDNPYSDAKAFQDGYPVAPMEDGKATVFSIEVEKGVGSSLMLRNYRVASIVAKESATFPAAYKSGTHEYERYDADTLLPKPTGIDAFNLGAYYTCIGAGTRIKVVGVRE